MQGIATRRAFGEVLLKIGREVENVVVLSADNSHSTCTELFAREFPGRFFNFGIAEQNTMTIAAGLASTGKIVFVGIYAVFASMRACEQIRTFIAYPGLNVKIAATHAGLSVGPDGVTHQATEDVAILRSIPGMTIVQPADAISTKKAIKAVVEYSGPVYIRLTRNSTPVIFDEGYQFTLGKGVEIERIGTDVTLIGTGIMVPRILAAAEILRKEGIRGRVVEIHTIKPIDKRLIVRAAKETGGIVTAEDHNIIGGLGSAVAEVISDVYPVPIRRVGLQDRFGESGPAEELLDKYGLGIKDIVKAAKEVLEAKTKTRY